VQAQDAPHFVHRERMALHGVPGSDHQLGLHALDVRARILDDAIVAILDRPRSLDRDDRVRVNAGAIGMSWSARMKWWRGFMLSTLVGTTPVAVSASGSS